MTLQYTLKGTDIICWYSREYHTSTQSKAVKLESCCILWKCMTNRNCVYDKAYIPLRRKTIRVGSWHWLTPPTPQFCVGYTNILVSN